MNSKKISRGFTLIELLVVISIIGLLSSVVLASLNTARAKGADGTIKGNMASMRAQGELFYDDHGQSYGTPLLAQRFTGGACPAGTSIFSDQKIVQAIAASIALVGPGAAPSCAIGPSGATWAVSVPLKTGGSWCISSTGGGVLNKYAAGGLSTAATCDGTSAPADSGCNPSGLECFGGGGPGPGDA